MSRLKIMTAGSVDDGKSTLIGRLLLDSGSLSSDTDTTDLARITDGLVSEREQGITIDVAYRYFQSQAASFALLDAPGHEQYTRNVVTAASSADLMLILVDATRGIQSQTKVHRAIADLLQVPVIYVINKLDAVGYSQERYQEIAGDLDGAVVPISALYGDNLFGKSVALPWYEGSALMTHLQLAWAAKNVPKPATDIVRLSVQAVVRDGTKRTILVRNHSGTVAVGDELITSQNEQRATVASVSAPYEGSKALAITLDKDIDVGRGTLLYSQVSWPLAQKRLPSSLIWLSHTPLHPERSYILRQRTFETRAKVVPSGYSPLQVNQIDTNAIVHTSSVVRFDSYRANKETGSFILIDPANFETVAAGVL